MPEEINANSCAVRRSKLTNAMEIRLRAFGSFVWRTQKTSAGLPILNCLIGGDYYGFYPSGVASGGAQDLSEVERTMARRLREEYNANVFIVCSIDGMEKIMGMNARAVELRNALPTGKLKDLLKLWGKGKLVDSPLEAEIMRLSEDLRAVIFGLYLDKMTKNKIAESRGWACPAYVFNMHHKALDILRDRLLSKGTYLDEVGPAATKTDVRERK
jgi:hypothetical protein